MEHTTRPKNGARRWWLPAVCALALVAGCASGDDDTDAEGDSTTPTESADDSAAPDTSGEPSTTADEVTTTTAAPTTTEATTTTTSTTTTSTTTTTTVPEPTGTGVVWASVVDDSRINIDGEPPTWTEGALTWSIDLVLSVPAAADTELQRACREEARFQADVYGGEPADECLVIQVRFQVAADAEEEGRLYLSDLVTPDGQQFDLFIGDEGRPGTVDNGFTVLAPGGTPASRTFWQVEGGFGASSYIPDFEWVVPGPEFFQSIYFD